MVLGGHIWGHGLVKWGHQGHLGNASQPVEVVMVTAQLVAMRCTWCDRAGHQVTPGYRASASMQRVEAVMVTAQLVAMRCTWCDHAGAWSVSCFSLLPLSFFMCARSNRAS